MSVSYIAARQNDGDSEEVEFDGLLNGQAPSSVRIESYIPAKKRTILFDTGVLVVIVILFVTTVSVVSYYASKPKASTQSKVAKGWMNTYQHTGSESVMRLIDVNGDSSDDAVFGIAQPSTLDLFIHQAPYCKKYTQGCLAAVFAVDGRTGAALWNISTYNEIFELNCGNIDVNKDGKMDCLGAGRRGSFTAFSPHSGRLLWTPQTGQEPYIAYAWNIYNPLIVDDINNDGVPEVLLAHGGDPEFSPENKTRQAGRLLLLNGATGQLIGRYLEMPDGRETYNSPVLHRDRKGVQYVIIGTGGETVNGGLFIAPLKDIVTHVTSSERQIPIPRLKGLRVIDDGPFYRLVESREKGVMVPVVLVDLNHDDCCDLVVSSFDGVLAAYDGDTFKKLWMFEDRQGESYTTPGVGYFNNDRHLDLMMHWNYGVWPNYNKSVIMVHSGYDGRPLWLFNTTRFSMTSDLVIRTEDPHQDMFVFRVQGRAGNPVDSGTGVVHGVDPQRNLEKNNGAGNAAKSCGLKDYDILASEVFIVNWETRNSPRRVFRRDVDKYHYNVAAELDKTKHWQHSGVFSKLFNSDAYKNGNRCAIMEQSSRTTGAIGDINNDGLLDLVLTFNAQGIINDVMDNYLRAETSLDLVAIELEKNYQRYPELKGNKEMVPASNSKVSSVRWKSSGTQIWTGYMGADSRSIYKL